MYGCASCDPFATPPRAARAVFPLLNPRPCCVAPPCFAGAFGTDVRALTSQGDGHHFCTFEREGSRFSNGGGNGNNCGGSEGDSIYWAWDDDEHGCNNALRIGTGCARRHAGGPTYGFVDGAALPTFRYNFMLVH